ncbi:hypothetical protein Tco_1093900 [Tanacetum coccineum]|uniref:Gag protein n=1 Tax=Tanacetum coccineum TaxID=301880 RepID=A0ABQ5IG50_9ASTR
MTSSNSQMHNDIMAAGSKERPPMLAPSSYAQWKSCFMRYVDTNPNKELLRKCIYEGLYEMTVVQFEDTPLNDENPRQRAEAVHMILNEIGNDIYSTVDACPNAKEMWIAIERFLSTFKMLRQSCFWNLDTDDESNEQELEAHYMYMAKIQEVLHATNDNFGPTFDTEPLEKVQSNDDYNMFATKRQHFEQPESINDTYVVKKVDRNVIPDSSDMSTNEGEADKQAEELEDERVLLASLIANLKLNVDENQKDSKPIEEGKHISYS